MQMKWDDSGWYKWNESEMKYISQVKEPEEDIREWNKVKQKQNRLKQKTFLLTWVILIY